MKKNYDDLIGQKFGRLMVLEIVKEFKSNRNRVYAICQCDCGNTKKVDYYKLLSGHTKSCGCLNKEFIKNLKFKDLTGQRFGKLVVIKYLGESRWLCQCDCGNTTIVTTGHLTSNHTNSCGCNKVKHGLANTRLYSVWFSMRYRCLNPKTTSYKNYGGRGITVCDEWLDKENGFMNFYNWAMQNGYDENAKYGECTIDRINNNGNYEPSNCRWVSIKEQCSNRRSNTIILYEDKEYTLSEWSSHSSISSSTICQRLSRGWELNKAIITPVRKRKYD